MSEQLVVVGVDGSPAGYTALRWTLAHTRVSTRAAMAAQRVLAPAAAEVFA